MRINKKLWLVASAIGVCGVTVGALPGQATPSTQTSVTLAQAPIGRLHIYSQGRTLANRHWDAILSTHGASDGYVVQNNFQPGQTTGWHSHPGPSIIFVVTGTVTNFDSSNRHCRGRSYSAGSSFVDPGGTDVHMLVDTGADPAETIAVQVIPSGQARRVDEPQPPNCGAHS